MFRNVRHTDFPKDSRIQIIRFTKVFSKTFLYHSYNLKEFNVFEFINKGSQGLKNPEITELGGFGTPQNEI